LNGNTNERSLRKKKAKKAKLALEARNNNTSDEDSDLSNAFSDCSISEDED
jgi:hypothetical protein